MYQTSLASWELGTDIFKGRMIPAERFTLNFHLPNNALLLVLTEVHSSNHCHGSQIFNWLAFTIWSG